MARTALLPRRVTRTLADGSIAEYWYCRSSGQRVPAPSAAAVLAARAVAATPLEKARARAALAEGPDATFEQIVAAWKVSPHWLDLAPMTRRMHEQTMGKPAWKDLARLRCAEITTRHLAQLRDALAVEGMERRGRRLTGVANQFLNTVASCWGWAAEARGIGPNPCAGVTRFRTQRSFPTWSDADFAAWLGKAPTAIGRVIQLAGWTALRRADLLTLRWQAWDGQALSVQPQKTRGSSGAVLRLPLSPEANATLAAWEAESRCEFVLADEHGRPWVDGRASPGHSFRRFENAWAKARADHNLPARSLHGIRATVATRLYDSGEVPAHDIMAVTGHTTEKAFLRYVKSSDQEARAARAATVLARVLPIGAGDGA